MHVMLAAPSLARSGGVTRSVLRAVRSLRGAGHRVTRVSADEALFPGDVRAQGDDVTFGPSLRAASSAALLHAGQAEEHAAAMTSIGAQARPDVVLGYYATTAGRAAVVAARALGAPSVVATRGNDVDRDLLGGGGLGEAVRATLRAATAVMAVSREMVERVRVHAGAEATFVSNAVDRDVFHPDAEAVRAFAAQVGLDPDRPALGVFGDFKEKRGLERLYGLPAEVLAPFELLLVGTVREEVRHLVPPGARVIPALGNDAALRGAYGACAAVLHPSTADGMPNVVLEAMACGRVVIVSPAGGLRDAVTHGETGWICETGEAWPEALRLLREGAFAGLGEAARARVPTPDQEREAIEAVLAAAMRRYAESSASR